MLQIQRGDIISVGGHRFGCGDIDAGDLLQFAKIITENGIFPEMVYTDPPWSDRNCRYWRTMAQASPSIEEYPHRKLIREIFGVIKTFGSDLVLIEQSSHEDLLMVFDEAERAEYEDLGQWIVSYGPKSKPLPNKILLFALPKMGESIIVGFDPTGMHDKAMTRYVFNHFAIGGETVFDPCIGLGTTARMAHEYDMRCVGFELDPNRLVRTIAMMTKLTGAAPKHEGSI